LTPGTYYGGICIGTATNGKCDPCNTSSAANADVTLADGIYVLAGGGFHVCGSSVLHAPNVVVYNTRDPAHTAGNGTLDQVELNTTGSVNWGPQASGLYKGLTIFQDPSIPSIKSGDSCDQHSTSAPDGEWDIALVNMADTGANGKLGSISGTIYAASDHAMFGIQVGGTATLAVITDCIFIDGVTATFNFDISGGLFGIGTELTE
jgi:hypothetical protein